MKLTTRCRYGTRAMAEIALNYGIRATKKREISGNQNIPDSYLENILADLKKAELIETIRGVNGGYKLSRSPLEITILDIISTLDGGMEPVNCLKDKECSMIETCGTRNVWRELQIAQETVLKRYSLADLTGRKFK